MITRQRFDLALRELQSGKWERFEQLASAFLAGDFDEEYPSKAQNDALRRFLMDYEELEIVFHRDIQDNRTCPGKNLNQQYLDDLLREVSTEDEEKAKEIQACYSQVDILRKVVATLIKIINRFK